MNVYEWNNELYLPSMYFVSQKNIKLNIFHLAEQVDRLI